MGGLLIRELKLRGLAERILVVCPVNLAFQWQRELKEKFDEKFLIVRGGDIRDQFVVNQWLEHNQVITSLDLAKRTEILPGLRQVHWDLIIVDEAHRMSWTPPARKTARYALGELLRDTSDHLLLLTATPHKGDPANFTLFLQLLDQDAYADVRSIREAMNRRRAPFYLRRTKEAMVYFPERQADGSWVAMKIFTHRIPHTADFEIDGEEFQLYRDVTRFVKTQSAKAAAQGDDPRARVVDGLGRTVHERLFAMELSEDGQCQPHEPSILGNLIPAPAPSVLPALATLPEATVWLNEQALQPFLEEVRGDRQVEAERIANHVELSLTELLQKVDEEIGRAAAEIEQKAAGAEGRLAQAEGRHADLLHRRDKRRQELERQRSLSLQAVERIASVLILPHPEREAPDVRNLRPNPETEAIAMRVVIEHEQAQGRQVFDVHEKNLGYDITSLDLTTGELRLIEVKGIGAASGTVVLTPNERRVAEDRRDCYWLYVVRSARPDPRAVSTPAPVPVLWRRLTGRANGSSSLRPPPPPEQKGCWSSAPGALFSLAPPAPSKNLLPSSAAMIVGQASPPASLEKSGTEVCPTKNRAVEVPNSNSAAQRSSGANRAAHSAVRASAASASPSASATCRSCVDRSRVSSSLPAVATT